MLEIFPKDQEHVCFYLLVKKIQQPDLHFGRNSVCVFVCVCVYAHTSVGGNGEHSIANSIVLYHYIGLSGYIIILLLPQLLRVQQ